MTTKNSKAGRCVVIAIDGSVSADHAFETYVGALQQTGDSVLLVACNEFEQTMAAFWKGNVLDCNPDILRDQLSKGEEKAKNMLNGYASKLQEAGVNSKTSVLVTQHAGSSIVSAAEAQKADLIVVGSHGNGQPQRTQIGSCSDYILKHTAIPVVVCKQRS